MYPKWLWPAFALPGVVWLILLFMVPFYAVVGVAFGSLDPVFLMPVPAWNPLDWDFETALTTAAGFLPGREYWSVFLRTTEYVFLSVAICLLIGYPVAYYISRHTRRTKSILLALIILPFWVSYLMRMFAWINLFAPSGYVNKFLVWSTIAPTPPDWLNGNATSVVLGLAYGYIPYLILPLLAALDRIDRSVLEAARDLGASPFRAFLHVTLPLSKTGILGASAIVILPMYGDYYTPNIISGSPRTSMIGNQIDIFFHGGPQPGVGATITLIMSAFLGVLMVYYLFSIAKAQREAQG